MTGASQLSSTCGQLILGGFPGTSLPPAFECALRERRRGGAILFRQNVEGGPRQTAALAREIHRAVEVTPLLGVDQEGGRVSRLPRPFLHVPPMRTVASRGDPALARRIAAMVGAQLSAAGFTIDFAPVLDVNTCPDNPVIGDRAFGDDPAVCARFGTAWIEGLQSTGVLATAKHFPGHGDTSKDSHVDLPVVRQPRDRLERVELLPFRAAASASVAAMMTAHVVYSALDDGRPATLSRAVCTELRASIGFDGMLVSDDLEMQAIAARASIEEAAVGAIEAGCDAILICWSEDKQERALAALVQEAERSPAFRARCRQAEHRVARARSQARARPLDDGAIDQALEGPQARALADEIERRLAP